MAQLSLSFFLRDSVGREWIKEGRNLVFRTVISFGRPEFDLDLARTRDRERESRRNQARMIPRQETCGRATVLFVRISAICKHTHT